MKQSINLLFAVLALFLPFTASAAGVAAGDDFWDLYEFLERNLSGGLAVGIALAAFVIGAGIGAYMNSAKPMIAGVVIAIFFAFGPNIIIDLIAGSLELAAPLAGV